MVHDQLVCVYHAGFLIFNQILLSASVFAFLAFYRTIEIFLMWKFGLTSYVSHHIQLRIDSNYADRFHVLGEKKFNELKSDHQLYVLFGKLINHLVKASYNRRNESMKKWKLLNIPYYYQGYIGTSKSLILSRADDASDVRPPTCHCRIFSHLFGMYLLRGH